MHCPKCRGLLESDGTCSCGYGIKRRAEQVTSKPQPSGCAWSDVGVSCQHRGILSHSTNGTGSWYCREHWERLEGRAPNVVGNREMDPPKSQGVREWHAANLEHAWNQAIAEEKRRQARKAA